MILAAVLATSIFPGRFVEIPMPSAQFVNVSMTVDRRAGALIVPARAVQTGQQGQFVYVVKSGNGVELRPVSVFRTIQQDVIIESGLAVGETVVTDGQLRLTPKSKVEIKV